MHKNPLWLAFLGCLVLVVLWYTGVAGYRYWRYDSLRAQAAPTAMEWSVKQVSSDVYVPLASYSFEVDGKSYHSESSLKDEIFRNSFSANHSLHEFQNKKWLIWYSPKNPNYSSLQKSFPTKECISAAVLWGVLLYFLWLGTYVARRVQR